MLVAILIISSGTFIFSLFIFKNQKTMSAQLDAISADLDAANASLIKIKADIASLNSQIQNVDTLEALAAVKAKSAQLVLDMQAVDDETPDAP